MKSSLHFGYKQGSGHYLSDSRGIVHDIRGQYPGFPWDEGLLDGGLLRNGKILDDPDGRVYWTAGGRLELWHAFYWWDRSGDHRGNSGSGFYCQGFNRDERREAFEFACTAWPEIINRQLHRLVLVPYYRCGDCRMFLGRQDRQVIGCSRCQSMSVEEF